MEAENLHDPPGDYEVAVHEPVNDGILEIDETPDSEAITEIVQKDPDSGEIAHVDIERAKQRRLHRVQRDVLLTAAGLLVFYPVFAGILAQTDRGAPIAEQLMGNPFASILGVFAVAAGYAFGSKS